MIGGTRFLGYAIARRLLDAGHRVTIFSRGRSPLFPEGASAIHGDRSDHEAFRRALRGQRYDVVIDMMAFDEADSLAAVDAFDGVVGHFIHISTAAVYTVLDRVPVPLREEHFAGRVRQPSRPGEGHAYGVGKRRSEEVLWRAYEERGFPVTILRLPIFLGALDYTRRAAAYCHRILDGKPLILPDGGANAMTFVYRDDVADFIAAGLGNPRIIGEALNLAQDEVPTVRRLIAEAARILDHEPDLVDIPLRFLREIEFDFTASPYSSPRPLILDSTKARRLADFAPTPMVNWLPEVVEDAASGEPPFDPAARAREMKIANAYRDGLIGIRDRLAGRPGSGHE
jgi:nucleoside-diphosphate-sugar epimerase